MLALHCLICNVVLACEGLHAFSLAFSKLLTISLIHQVYTLNTACTIAVGYMHPEKNKEKAFFVSVLLYVHRNRQAY